MKRTPKLAMLAFALSMALATNISALAAQDVPIEEKTVTSGLDASDMYVMPGPDGQQCIGYLVTNYNSIAVNLGLNIEFRDAEYGNIGSGSSFVPSVEPGETVFISVPNYYEETASYLYRSFSVAAAGETTAEPSGVSCSKMYTLIGPDGQQCAGYVVTNENSYDIFLGLTVDYLDDSNESIGTSSACIPCLGAGATACIYAVNYYGEDAAYANSSWAVSESIYESAAANIQINLSAQDDHMRVSAVNMSSGAVSLPEVTILYFQEAEPVYVYSGLLTDTNGYEGLGEGSGGFLNLDLPSSSWDTCYYYVTAYSSGS
ncbi:MAG: hypothetical protein LUF27_11960 [Lachnospiraceae bacterium]|nr:hypothetical protein [Lachnospiraceae bacterium]